MFTPAMGAPYTYRRGVLDMLAVHGVFPTPHTRPELVRDLIRDIYKYELRRLRDRYIAGEFPKRDYWGMVDRTRRKYPVLMYRAHEFLE